MAKYSNHLEDRNVCGGDVLEEKVSGSVVIDVFPSLVEVCLQGSVYHPGELVEALHEKLLNLKFFS